MTAHVYSSRASRIQSTYLSFPGSYMLHNDLHKLMTSAQLRVESQRHGGNQDYLQNVHSKQQNLHMYVYNRCFVQCHGIAEKKII